ncbi:hypothetical protein DMENIID0001_013930 [Sergentomyia squamirostris]
MKRSLYLNVEQEIEEDLHHSNVEASLNAADECLRFSTNSLWGKTEKKDMKQFDGEEEPQENLHYGHRQNDILSVKFPFAGGVRTHNDFNFVQEITVVQCLGGKLTQRRDQFLRFTKQHLKCFGI